MTQTKIVNLVVLKTQSKFFSKRYKQIYCFAEDLQDIIRDYNYLELLSIECFLVGDYSFMYKDAESTAMRNMLCSMTPNYVKAEIEEGYVKMYCCESKDQTINHFDEEDAYNYLNTNRILEEKAWTVTIKFVLAEEMDNDDADDELSSDSSEVNEFERPYRGHNFLIPDSQD